jgi:hypothetical protein
MNNVASMSHDKPTSAPAHPRRRMLWLLVGHVVVGPVVAVVTWLAGTDSTPWTAAFSGIVFSQASLLGIWGSLGTGSWWRRVIAVVIGVGYLGLLLGASFAELDHITFSWVFAATTMSALPLLLARFFRVAIRLDSTTVGSPERTKFSIRHLLTLTLVVAVLIATRNCVEPYAIEVIETPDGAVLNYLDEAVYDWLSPIVVAGLSILPIWFVLATKQPMLPCVGLLAAAVSAGNWLARFYDDAVSLGVIFTISEAMVVAVSLFVIRSCGYRLVRLPPRC